VKLYDIDPGPKCPEVVRAIIEIPKNSVNKYEYDGELGLFRLDRALYSPMHYPGDYGFIPGTLAEDDDPLDVLVLVDEPSFTGCLMEVRPVGILHMIDEKEQDQKILAVPSRNPRFDSNGNTGANGNFDGFTMPVCQPGGAAYGDQGCVATLGPPGSSFVPSFVAKETQLEGHAGIGLPG